MKILGIDRGMVKVSAHLVNYDPEFKEKNSVLVIEIVAK
jgi:hypothetical protein